MELSRPVEKADTIKKDVQDSVSKDVVCILAGETPLRMLIVPEHCLHRVWTEEPWLFLRLYFSGCHVKHWVRTVLNMPK